MNKTLCQIDCVRLLVWEWVGLGPIHGMVGLDLDNSLKTKRCYAL